MAEPAWMTKYQAREALKNGRPEDAHRLLESLVASGDRRLWALRADVVRGYVERGERSLRNDDVDAAWDDLNAATSLSSTSDPGVNRLRENLVNHSVAELRAMLEAGKPLQCLEAIGRFRERNAPSLAVTPLEEAARDWQAAIDHADKGEFTLARPLLDRVRPKLAARTIGLNHYEEALNTREDRFRVMWAQLQESTVAGDWREILRNADEVLQVAPRHREAQQSRNRAWQMLQPDVVRPTPKLSETTAFHHAPPPDSQAGLPKRFFLWIDGIGAYLVCLGNRVSIGQATSEGPIDVPIFADVARIHAMLTRDAECYLLEASKAVTLNGQPADQAVLQEGDRISLGSSCHFNFTQPVPGGMTARLTLAGARRLPMAVDGVLLMADILVLGPGDKTHIQIPELEKPVYIVRQKEQLIVKSETEIRIEGQKFDKQATLPRCGTITIEPISFAIEPVK